MMGKYYGRQRCERELSAFKHSTKSKLIHGANTVRQSPITASLAFLAASHSTDNHQSKEFSYSNYSFRKKLVNR